MPPADPPEHHPVTLSPEDAAALDVLRGGGDTSHIDPARLARVEEWVAVVQSAPAPTAPVGLADRTLAAILRDQASPAPTDAPIPPTYKISPWPRRLREWGAIGAAAGILVAVLIPGISQARQSSRRVACAANLSAASVAFATYAGANSNLLPALAAPADHDWLARNGHASNADNLLPLIAAAYLTPDRLACPGRGTPDPLPSPLATLPDSYLGYSYTVAAANNRRHWDGSPDTLVLADRNPLFDPRCSDPSTTQNSINHNEKGNYLLAADGSVSWQTNPNCGPHKDNMWTLGPPQTARTVYAGTETSTPDDAFLAP